LTSTSASLYLDEDVNVVLAEMLKAHGFRTITARDAGMLGTIDEDQLRFASMHRLALVTHNRADFLALHRRSLAENLEHWGIIIALQRAPARNASLLLGLLERLTAEDLKGQLLYV
jgi:hypothetical protein